MLGKTEGYRRGKQRMRSLDSITNPMYVNLSKFQEIVKIEQPGVLQSMKVERIRHYLVTEQQHQQYPAISPYAISLKPF